MKIIRFVLTAVLWIGLLEATPSDVLTYYVALGGQTPSPPYTNWSTAATNIQDAVDQARTDYYDIILVSNGVYETGGTNMPSLAGNLTNRIYFDKRTASIRSVNGPAVTIIKGKFHSGEPRAAGTITNGPAAIRCVYMRQGAYIIGFTLTNGATDNASAAQNVDKNAGGVYGDQAYCTLSNCVITGNSGQEYGGGINRCKIYNCTIVGNVVGSYGGGSSDPQVMYNCLVKDNVADTGGGVCGGTVYNCLITGNSARDGGGTGRNIKLYNCTVVSNSASRYGGGVVGAYQGSIVCDSIIYFNTGCVSSNWCSNDASLNFTNSCTAPVPVASGQGGWVGSTISWTNLVTNDPQFVSSANGNYRLSKTSPCINTGTNFSWMAGSDVGSKDLDGYRRLDKFSDRTDMGCYEYMPVFTIYVFH